jgi:hypothetical protein
MRLTETGDELRICPSPSRVIEWSLVKLFVLGCVATVALGLPAFGTAVIVRVQPANIRDVPLSVTPTDDGGEVQPIGKCDAQGIVFNARWVDYVDIAVGEYTRVLFDGVEPDPIVRVIGAIRTVRIDRHPSAINQRSHPRRTARPCDRGMMPEELIPARMMRRTA